MKIKNSKYLYLLLLIIPLVVFFVSHAYSLDLEVHSISIETDDYNEPGSFHIDKSAKWKGFGTAEITFNFNSIAKTYPDHYKDIILVIDVSSSMEGDKLSKVISDSLELTENVLSDPNNRMALVTFSYEASINKTLISNKQEMINEISHLSTISTTNYYAGLKQVDPILTNYQKEDNRDLVILFLTDGYPNEDTPNEVAMYKLLKEKYPYCVINGIQYEMGYEVVPEIRNITDNQWVADMNTLNNVLFEASVRSDMYKEFVISDYINHEYFYVDSINDINVSRGYVDLVEESGVQKVIWSLNSTPTGISSEMKIKVKLKDNYLEQGGLYPTNEKETIVYKIENNEPTNIESTKTPILKNNFVVSYNPNSPSGCNLDSIPNENYFVGTNVNIKSTILSCPGYLFKNWVIEDEDRNNVNYINDDTIIMPDHNVRFRAVWTKQSLAKSMNGSVMANENTLYRVFQDEAAMGTYAKEYLGPHQDSNTQPTNRKIYHWYADRDDNETGSEIPNRYNVKFGDYCWRMIRTTDTGGVRLLYNGKYDSELKCSDDRGSSGGISYSRSNDTLNDEIETAYFADDYTYDPNTGTFTLVNPELLSFSDNHYQHIIGKYYCRDNHGIECDYFSKIVAYIPKVNDDYGELYLLKIDYSSPSDYGNYSTISSLTSMNYDYRRTIANSGYMFGDNIHYTYDKRIEFASEEYIKNYYTFYDYESLSTYYSSYFTYYIADSYTETVEMYDENEYKYYAPNNPIDINTITNHNDLIGKYLFSSTDSSYSYKYIVDVDGYYLYYVSSDRSKEYYEYTSIYIGDSITENQDYSYTINNATVIRPSDLANNPSSYENKIICLDGKETCYRPRKLKRVYTSGYYSYYLYLDFEDAATELLIAKGKNGLNLTDTLIVSKSELLNNFDNYRDYLYTCGTKASTCTEDNLKLIYGVYEYDNSSLSLISDDYYYGSDVTWDGTKYTLVDPVGYEVYLDDNLFSRHHYFCLDKKTTSCETVGYIIYLNFSTSPDYVSFSPNFIKLTGGEKNVQSIFNSMMKTNTNSSFLKILLEEWYSRTMVKYNDYIEDSAYCNDRKPLSEDNGWNKIDGNIYKDYETRYNNYNSFESYLSGNTDSSSYYTPSLKCDWETDRYSVDNPKAKLNYPVATVSYDELALFNNQKARKLETSILTFNAYGSGASIIAVYNGGWYYGSSSYPVSPMITLKYDTQYVSGNGSKTNPYIVDTSNVD